MRYTETKYSTEAREELLNGIKQVSDAVSVTIGARGRNGVYRDMGMPIVTNDGVSIVRKIKPRDEFQRLGADLIKDAAERTNADAGDGTTTSVVLSHSLIENGMQLVNDGEYGPMDLRRELNEDKDKLVKEIEQVSEECKEYDDILNVAKVSVEDDEVAETVAEATQKAGENGAVLVEEGSGYDIEKEEVQGYFWERGFASPYMITDANRNEAILDDTHVIVTDKHLNRNSDLMQVISEIHKSGATSCLVVAEKVEGELLHTFIQNRLNGNFTAVAVEKPGTNEELEDIAALTNAEAVTKEKGITDVSYSHCGKAKRVVVSKHRTMIVTDDTKNEMTNQRIEALKSSMDSDEEETTDLQKERMAKLTEGIVMLRVGAKTQADKNYLTLKVDDAVNACKAALEEGIVEGGGVTLYRLADKVKNPALKKALKAPYEMILKNAGIKPDGATYNVLTGEEVDDMKAQGIIDPAKVTRCAVENAVSLAGTFLTVETTVTEHETESQQ